MGRLGWTAYRRGRIMTKNVDVFRKMKWRIIRNLCYTKHTKISRSDKAGRWIKTGWEIKMTRLTAP